jgi:hypothetical protein
MEFDTSGVLDSGSFGQSCVRLDRTARFAAGSPVQVQQPEAGLDVSILDRNKRKVAFT